MDFEGNFEIDMSAVQNRLESFESEGRSLTPLAPISKPATGLHVYNSLSREKVPFVTRDGSNKVSWYICGPTVYDSSHLGHARNYVTFDIIRRIMEEYFGYDIHFVMNVTDVDDKIINRARRSYLLDRFLATATNPDQVTVEFEEAYDREHCKQIKQLEVMIREHGRARSLRQLDEIAAKVKQEELKLQKIGEVKERFEQLKREACDLGGKEGVEKLLSAGIADILAAHLDVKGKASVTDHAIFRSHAARYEREFMEDMRSLGVQDPDVLTRVTEYIHEIIEYVQVILHHGLAYVANNSVYFDTKAFRDAGHTYGKLNPWAVGSSELASESESNFETREKRSSCDFALWKKSKEGEPAWESPWGMGRPGWHIECSAMASDILGDCMDIHSGGHDLQFPHHDNELAQAEAYFNSSEWVKYFFHSGHLSIDGLKMSKSLKNFITIKEALQKYTSRQLRMLFVIHAWDKPINFSEAAVNEALGKEKQFKNFFSNLQVEMRQAALEDVQRWGDDEKQLERRIEEVKSKVRVRLEDNFDTAGAVSELLLLVKDVHSYIDKCNSMSVKLRIFIIEKAAVYITTILSIFGLSDAGRGDIGFGSSGSEGFGKTASLEVVVAPYLDTFAGFRDQVRTAAREGASKEKFLELADRVRDETMVDLGVRFEDKGGKSTWKLDDPEVLRRERDENVSKGKEKLLRKEVARRELEEKKQKAREQKLQRKQQQKAGRDSLSESCGSDDYLQQQKQLSTVQASDPSKNSSQIRLPELENDSILFVGRKATFEGGDAIEFLFKGAEDMSKVVGVGLQWCNVVVTEQFEVIVRQMSEHMWSDLWKETSFVPMSIKKSSKRFGVGLMFFRFEGLCMYGEDNVSKQTGEMLPLIVVLAGKMGLKSENSKPSGLQRLKGVSTDILAGEVRDEGGSLNEALDGGDHDQGATSHEPMEGAVSNLGGTSSEHMELGGQVDEQSLGVISFESLVKTSLEREPRVSLTVIVIPEYGGTFYKGLTTELAEPDGRIKGATIAPWLRFEFERVGNSRTITTTTVTHCDLGGGELKLHEDLNLGYYHDNITISLTCEQYPGASVLSGTVSSIDGPRSLRTETLTGSRCIANQMSGQANVQAEIPLGGVGMQSQGNLGEIDMFGETIASTVQSSNTQFGGETIASTVQSSNTQFAGETIASTMQSSNTQFAGETIASTMQSSNTQFAGFLVNPITTPSSLRFNFLYHGEIMEEIAKGRRQFMHAGINKSLWPTIVGEWLPLDKEECVYKFTTVRDITCIGSLMSTAKGEMPVFMQQRYELCMLINHEMSHIHCYGTTELQGPGVQSLPHVLTIFPAI